MVPYETPHLIWGNNKDVGKTIPFYNEIRDIYLKFQESSKICGILVTVNPVLIICDLDIVKTVLIKDLHKVSDRRCYYNEKTDLLSAEDRWKILRSKSIGIDFR